RRGGRIGVGGEGGRGGTRDPGARCRAWPSSDSSDAVIKRALEKAYRMARTTAPAHKQANTTRCFQKGSSTGAAGVAIPTPHPWRVEGQAAETAVPVEVGC